MTRATTAGAAICLSTLVAFAHLAPPVMAADQRAVADALEAAVQRYSLGTFWGAVLVMQRGEIVTAQGFGLANEQLAPITANTIFDIGSNAKAFTALAVLILESDGSLALDDPVARFFPDVDGTDAITLRHLLTHTSGLSDETALQRLDFPDRDEAVRRAFATAPASASRPWNWRRRSSLAGWSATRATKSARCRSRMRSRNSRPCRRTASW